ncbi:hypothetical protein VP01_604g6 [Puccinia sorghi]|uniref:Uncharacterized protein n=1 Tax=Puccinia sorghi TaxID=27349 RepID=A0A0L6UH92_9BASI|nr:hypothetical protein VP01_604g6 [Puccinia sorghi]
MTTRTVHRPGSVVDCGFRIDTPATAVYTPVHLEYTSYQARGHAAITTTQSWFQSNTTFYMVFNLRSIPTCRLDLEDENNPRYPQPLKELLKQTKVQLTKVAEDHYKGCFSVDDEDFFLKLYQEQQKNLVIKASERGISLSMVHNFLGQRIAVREANKWNQFLQTDQARATFQMRGQGIKDQNVTNKLSEAYAKLKPEEKAALAKSATPTNTTDLVEELINCPDQMGTTFNQRPPPQTQPVRQRTQADCTLTGEELALDDPSEDDALLPSNASPTMLHSSLVRGSVSNAHRAAQAEKAMNRWLGEAVNIAQTWNCEVLFFAVTKHLSKHSFKITQWMPGAKESHQKISNLDGDMHYSAQLQVLITGNKVDNLAVAQKIPGMKKQNLKALLPQLTSQLARLIARPHQGPANTRS